MRPLSLRFPEGAGGRFRTSVSAAKNPVPGARKGVAPRASPRSCRCSRCALRVKSVNAKTGIRAGRDQAAQTAATIRPAHHVSWRRRCRAEACRLRTRRRPLRQKVKPNRSRAWCRSKLVRSSQPGSLAARPATCVLQPTAIQERSERLA